MDLTRIGAMKILDAMSRAGTRKAKIDAVADKLSGNTRYYQDDVLTLIVSGDSFGWAKRHVTNGVDAMEVAEWIAGELGPVLPKSDLDQDPELQKVRRQAGRLRATCDVPDADRGMAIAACRLLA